MQFFTMSSQRQVTIQTLALDDKTQNKEIVLSVSPNTTVKEIEQELIRRGLLYPPPSGSNERIEWIVVMLDGTHHAISPTTRVTQILEGAKLRALYRSAWG